MHNSILHQGIKSYVHTPFFYKIGKLDMILDPHPVGNLASNG